MPSISSLSFSRLKNTIVRFYFTRLQEIVKKEIGVFEGKAGQRMEEAIEQFQAALNLDSVISKTIAPFDQACDKAWKLCKDQLQLSLRHITPERREAAEQIALHFDIQNNPTKQAYENAYGALSKLIDNLAGIPAETLKLAHMDELVAYLRTTYNEFIEAYNAEIARKAQRPKGAVKDARSELSEAWKKFQPFLEWKSEEDPRYTSVILQFNQVVMESKAKQKTASSATSASEEGASAEGATLSSVEDID